MTGSRKRVLLVEDSPTSPSGLESCWRRTGLK